jgi:hypothetical protein
MLYPETYFLSLLSKMILISFSFCSRNSSSEKILIPHYRKVFICSSTNPFKMFLSEVVKTLTISSSVTNSSSAGEIIFSSSN